MFNKVLVPLDGSELAERALAPAFALARQRPGEVIVLRVPVPFPDSCLAGAGARTRPPGGGSVFENRAWSGACPGARGRRA